MNTCTASEGRRAGGPAQYEINIMVGRKWPENGGGGGGGRLGACQPRTVTVACGGELEEHKTRHQAGSALGPERKKDEGGREAGTT